MPICFCSSCSPLGGVDSVTGRARGIKQDTRTFKAHSLKDKKEAFLTAEKKAEEAVEAEIEEISAYLSATVLADKVSGPSDDPVGSLWSRDISFSDDSNTTLDAHSTSVSSTVTPSHPHRQAGSRRSREAEIILCLSDIEAEVNALLTESKKALTLLAFPSIGAPTQFPLSNLLDTSYSLKSRLDGIKFKGPAVLELKDSISRKLLLNEKNLTDTKRQWTVMLSDIKTINSPIHGIPYETCRFPNNYFLYNYTHFYVEPIISNQFLKVSTPFFRLRFSWLQHATFC